MESERNSNNFPVHDFSDDRSPLRGLPQCRVLRQPKPAFVRALPYFAEEIPGSQHLTIVGDDVNVTQAKGNVEGRVPLTNNSMGFIYSNILPYKNNAYFFQNPRGTSLYVNASELLGGVILSQGVSWLDNTEGLEAFWKMCWSAECDVIVMATELEEKNIRKCRKYWPEVGAAYLLNDGFYIIGIKEEEKKWFANGDLNNPILTTTYRTFKINHGEESRIIMQIHLRNWSDHCSLEGIEAALYDIFQEIDDKSLIAHCSAGIGRSGSFVACQYLFRTYKKAVAEGKSYSVDISKLVAMLRDENHGRYGTIQTKGQRDMVVSFAKWLSAARLN